MFLSITYCNFLYADLLTIVYSNNCYIANYFIKCYKKSSLAGVIEDGMGSSRIIYIVCVF